MEDIFLEDGCGGHEECDCACCADTPKSEGWDHACEGLFHSFRFGSWSDNIVVAMFILGKARSKAGVSRKGNNHSDAAHKKLN